MGAAPPHRFALHRRRRGSSQVRLIRAQRPIREPFIPVALFDEVAHHTVDVVAEFVAGDLVLPQFSSETTVKPQAAAQVYLESLDRAAVAVVDHLALESD